MLGQFTPLAQAFRVKSLAIKEREILFEGKIEVFLMIFLSVCSIKPCLKLDRPFTHKHVENNTTKRALITQNKRNLQIFNIVDDSISEPLLK